MLSQIATFEHILFQPEDLGKYKYKNKASTSKQRKCDSKKEKRANRSILHYQKFLLILSLPETEKYLSTNDHVSVALAIGDDYINSLPKKLKNECLDTILENININHLNNWTLRSLHSDNWKHFCRYSTFINEKFIQKWYRKVSFLSLKLNDFFTPSKKFNTKFPNFKKLIPCPVCENDLCSSNDKVTVKVPIHGVLEDVSYCTTCFDKLCYYCLDENCLGNCESFFECMYDSDWRM